MKRVFMFVVVVTLSACSSAEEASSTDNGLAGSEPSYQACKYEVGASFACSNISKSACELTVKRELLTTPCPVADFSFSCAYELGSEKLTTYYSINKADETYTSDAEEINALHGACDAFTGVWTVL